MSVEQLKSDRKIKKNQIDELKDRRDSIKRIISNIYNELDDDIRVVNTQIAECARYFSSGMKGISRLANIDDNMDSCKEKWVANNTTISSIRDYLELEVARCDREIDNISMEVEQLEKDIKSQGGTVHFWE